VKLREAGLLVRLRFSEINPGQVTGYSVSLPGDAGGDGTSVWYGGGRLSAGLTLPRLRERWDPSRSSAAGRPGAFRFTIPERDAIYRHAAREAAAAAEHIRHCSLHDPGQAADAAWAAADTLHAAARALDSRVLRRAADSYDRAARARYGRIPRPTREGNQLRAAARLIALTDGIAGDGTMFFAALIANLVALAVIYATLLIPVNIVLEATLSFLGLGVQPPTASWGNMIAEAQNGDLFTVAWWFLVFPCVALVLTTLAFNLLGDGLRDALDPRHGRAQIAPETRAKRRARAKARSVGAGE